MSASGRALLLVDIGNSRIKWAIARGARLQAAGTATQRQWLRGAFASRRLRGLPPVTGVVVVSVATARFNAQFARAVRTSLGLEPDFVATSARAAGVVNAYHDPWRLGVDRWVAVIAARHLVAHGRDACVVDVGTAVTIDLVDARARHRGGVIVPGPDLMVGSLLAGTSGIRRRAAGGRRRGATVAFARSTRDALESGSLRAVAATVDRFAAEARELLGRRPSLILTGGGAAAVSPYLRSRHRVVPDLVFRGLAVLAADARGAHRP